MALNSDKETGDMLRVEDADSDGAQKGAADHSLKLDENGLPLVPQPSDRKDDPLVRVPELN
jgi:hypothetical protein